MADLELFQGTLDLLVLRALNRAPQHGFGIARWIGNVTGERLRIEDGALYPALHRMERKRWITATWEITENRRKAKVYALTARGRKELAEQTGTWVGYVEAVRRIIIASADEGATRARR